MQQLNRSHSFHPSTVQREDIPALHQADEKTAQRKLEEIRNGGGLKESNPALPESRQNKDVFWVPVFLAVLATVVVFTFLNGHRLIAFLNVHMSSASSSAAVGAFGVVAGAGFLGAIASVVMAIVCLRVAHRHPEPVVYVSLYFSPSVVVIVGCAMMGASHGNAGILQCGAFLAVFGLLQFACVACCYRSLIPFMIDMVRMVSEVIITNPAMLIVAFGLSVTNLIWMVLCCLGMGGTLHSDDSFKDSHGRIKLQWLCLCLFIFFWGAYVIYNVCHVTYCGVFARSYYNRPMSEGPVRKSLGVALTSSFGSIIFGSCVIAFVKMLEQLASATRKEAAKNKNPVVCVLACCLECFIRCIGDIMEYFSAWSYVQCAVCGVSFMDSVRITFSMLTCAHLQYIIKDLILGTVINTGSLLCAVMGAAVAFAFGYASSDSAQAVACAWFGFVCALMSGGTAFGVIGSGVKTILVCWVDNPSPLKLSNEAMEEKFASRVNQGYDQHMGTVRVLG